jgi:hypothetical protein
VRFVDVDRDTFHSLRVHDDDRVDIHRGVPLLINTRDRLLVAAKEPEIGLSG